MRAALLLACWFAVAPLAAAQDHGGGGHGAEAPSAGHGAGSTHAVHISDVLADKVFWAALINFALLLVVLVKLGRKPLGTFLVGRRRGIEEGLADARAMKEAAQEKYDEYSTRLDQLDQELEQIRADMVKAGEEERDRIVGEAETKAARLRRETEFLVQQQIKQLRADVTREAVEAAISAAESVLTEQGTRDDQDRLTKAYLERLEVVAKEETRGAP